MKKLLALCLFTFGLLLFTHLHAQNLEDESFTTPGGVVITLIKEGIGQPAKAYDKIKVYYKGCLTSGECFDSLLRGKPFTFKLGKGEVIPGWDEAFRYLSKGAKARLYIPAELGYGKRGVSGLIPPDSDLIFEVEVK
jgi:FKBP-type peptidyl-prolyl cis-trans isomerase